MGGMHRDHSFMDYTEFTATIDQRISKLSYKKQLELSITICKKLFFDYQIFSEIEQWGNSDLLLDTIKLCEQSIDYPIDIFEIKSLLQKIDLIIPNTNDFGNNIGSYALNASASVYETLEFLINKDVVHIHNIASYYTDTIDFKIQEQKELTEIEINNHPLMIEAKNFLIERTK